MAQFNGILDIIFVWNFNVQCVKTTTKTKLKTDNNNSNNIGSNYNWVQLIFEIEVTWTIHMQDNLRAEFKGVNWTKAKKKHTHTQT